MALVTISGYPCSGKTYRAQFLRDFLEKRFQDPACSIPKMKVAVISDHSLNIDRNVYGDGRKEKPARATLFSAMQKLMTKDTILIVDAMNYIKGFRYQMFCAAKEHRLRVCTIYVAATPDLCRERNSARDTESAYEPAILENLITRYEEPSSMVRWDSPLITITSSDEDIPTEAIWTALTEGTMKTPNAGTSTVAAAPTDALQTLEQTSTALVSAIMSQQEFTQSMGGTVTLQISEMTQPRIILPARNITLSELQRLKRQFVTIHKKAITLGSTEKGSVNWDERSIADKFVIYIEENLRS